MRVLFIYPDLAADITNYTGVTSYAVSILSALLKHEGHEVSLYHLTAEPSAQTFQDRIRGERPDLIAFSTNSHYARRLADWTAWAAAAAAGAPVILGGVHPTLAAEAVLALPAVSAICVGEGEDAMLELCRALAAGDDPTSIRNLWFRVDGRIVRNPQRPLLADLDALPDPDYSIFAFDRLYPVRRGLFPYIMSRGCAFSCTYCSVHALREIAPGSQPYWRFLSPRRAAEQLRDLLTRYQPDAGKVQFLDAILYPHRKWLREFAPLYKELVGLPFSCNMRADFISEETAGILADMGCEIVRLGVESGDDDLTRDVLNRGLDLDDIRRAFSRLKAVGIARWSYNMLGLPEETLSRALATIRLNAELAPELALSFIFYPYPGTRLHQICAERGYLTGREFDHYFMGVATRMPGFAADDILFLHRFFRRLIRLYGCGRNWPPGVRRLWSRGLDAALTSPLLPRGAIVRAHDGYKGIRHRLGERLVRRTPRLYRWLGGTDPG